jgi:hypothetical protein
MSRSIEVGLTRGDETASKLLIPATSTIRVYGEEDIPELLTQLTDPDADARYRAAMALRGQSSSRDQVVPALTEALNSPLKKASLTGFHRTTKHIAAKAVSPSSETMRTI